MPRSSGRGSWADSNEIINDYRQADRSAQLAPGARVCVKPDRRFPAFEAGDRGVVVHVDPEARTCDVRFDGRVDGATVAMKHLFVEVESFDDAATYSSTAGSQVADHQLHLGPTGMNATGVNHVFSEVSAAGLHISGMTGHPLHAESMAAGLHVPGSLLGPHSPLQMRDNGVSSPLFGQVSEAGLDVTMGSTLRPEVSSASTAAAADEMWRTTAEVMKNSLSPSPSQAAVFGRELGSPADPKRMTETTPWCHESPIGHRELDVRAAASESHGHRHRDLSSAVEALERRVADCEAVIKAAGQESTLHSPASSRLVAMRVAALEGAHQAEIADLRRALDDATALTRDKEELQRKQAASARSIQAMTHAEQRVQDAIVRLGGELRVQERRASDLEQAVGAAGAGIVRLGAVLESKERRAAELGRVADDGLQRFVDSIGENEQRVSTLERRLEELHDAAERRMEELGSAADRCAERAEHAERSAADCRVERAKGIELERLANEAAQDRNGPVAKALQELQELRLLVVHESEHRAAGLREVLGVVAQGIEQLRGENTRQHADLDNRLRSEHRRLKHRIAEAHNRQEDHEKRTEALDERVKLMSQAFASQRGIRSEFIASVEEQAREVHRGRDSGRSPGGTAHGNSPADCEVLVEPPSTTQLLNAQSLQRLEALEARFDCTGARQLVEDRDLSGGNLGAGASRGRLRGQLESLRSEIVGDAKRADEMLAAITGNGVTQASVASDGLPTSPGLLTPAPGAQGATDMSPLFYTEAVPPSRSVVRCISAPSLPALRTAAQVPMVQTLSSSQAQVLHGISPAASRRSLSPTAATLPPVVVPAVTTTVSTSPLASVATPYLVPSSTGLAASEGTAVSSSQHAAATSQWQARTQAQVLSQHVHPVIDGEVAAGGAHNAPHAAAPQATAGGTYATPQAAAFQQLPHYTAYPAGPTPTTAPSTLTEHRSTFDALTVNEVAITGASLTQLPPWPSTPVAEQVVSEMQTASEAPDLHSLHHLDGFGRADAVTRQQVPTATVGLDTTHDGRANIFVTGVDRNRDGIPDLLQQMPQAMHAGPLIAGGTAPSVMPVPVAAESVRAAPSLAAAYIRQGAGSSSMHEAAAIAAASIPAGVASAAGTALPEGPVVVPAQPAGT